MLIPYADDNPTLRPPIVTVFIIIACCVAFLYEVSLDDPAMEAFLQAFAMIPGELFGNLPPSVAVPEWFTPITSMFLHGSLLHLAGNMLYLWVFGNNIEDAMGPVRFTVFYVLCGLAAALLQASVDLASEEPMIGASGAISGVLGAYLVLHPRANVRTVLLLGIIPIRLNLPAMVVLGFWIVVQAINAALTGDDMGGVAWFAHIGGFITGVALIPIFRDAHIPLFGGARQQGPWG